MRIESAMYASREGLQSHGQAIAVVGDNVANTETIGYKASRAEFSEMVSSGFGAKEDEPLRGGSGSQISTVRRINQTGDIDFTGRQLDVAITGEGYFVVGSASDIKYTRAGNFSVNRNGVLITSDGQAVLGAPPTADGTPGTGLAELNLLNINTNGTPTSTMTMTGNVSALGGIKTLPVNPTSFTELNGAANFQAAVTVYDSVGAPHDVSIYYFKTAANTWTAQAWMDGGDFTGGTAGTPVQLGENTTLTFNSAGIIETANQAGAAITGTPTGTYANGAASSAVTINMGGFTQNANASQLANVTQDGKGVGQVTGYEIGSTGEVSAVLTNGTRVSVGTIQMVKFTNPEGLQRVGGNTLVAGSDSGPQEAGAPGSGGRGDLEGGALERSTVDISNEFVRLVILQRGYQANSQMLGTTTNIIRDTIGLIR